MSVGMIIYGSVILLTALLMIGIGVFQYRGKKPAQISSGAPPVTAEELTDVKAWNHGHGIMWILYGVIMIAGFIISMTVEKPLYAGMAIMASVCLPIIPIPIVHNYLLKKYRRSDTEKTGS